MKASLRGIRSFELAAGSRPAHDCVRVHLFDGRVVVSLLPIHLGERLLFLIRASTAEMLRELGYGVIAAADGASALRLLDDNPEVALLLTDVGLPGGLNGRQLARETRRRRPQLRVLFTTGYARNAIAHHGRLDPGVELITKPFSLSRLGAKIRQVLSG